MVSKKTLGAMAAGVILVASLTGGAIAATNAGNTSTADQKTAIHQQMEQERASYMQNFKSKLAGNLGIDVSKLTEALQTTKKQMLDEAVQQGKITQAQADKMASNENEFGFFGGFQGGPDGQMGKGPMNTEAVAGILGMTADELKAELESGKKMDEIITEKGLTQDQFHQKMLAAQKESLAQDVASGKITQEQADQMIQRMEQHKDKLAQAPEDSGQSDSN